MNADPIARQEKNPKAADRQVFRKNVARARILGLLLVLLFGAHAMAYGQQQVVDLSTGVDTNQIPISPVPAPIPDPKWEIKPPGGSFQPVWVTTGTTASLGTPWASDPHAKWISPYIDGAGNMDSPGSAQVGDFIYRRRFDLAQNCPISNALISFLKVGGDNAVTAVAINGHSHPLTSIGFSTLSSTTVTVPPGEINSGGNTVEITVNNQGDYTGLFVYGNLTLNFNCPTVGVNKDLQNDTGQVANDIEILLAGSYTNVSHWDGHPANHFASFTVTPAAGGNTLLTWSHPNNDVQPGQIIHVGFNVPGSTVNILCITWTRDGKRIGCPNQVSTNTHAWGSAGSQVVYTNNTSCCCPISRYVGGLIVQWYREPVPLAKLNRNDLPKPMKRVVVRKAAVRLTQGATASVSVPAAPAGANFGVVVLKVGTSATLAEPDVTTDFLEFPVQRGPRPVQAAGSPQAN